MLKRYITLLFLLVVLVSACSRNNPPAENQAAEKDALVSTKERIQLDPSATPPQSTDTPRSTDTPFPTESPVPTFTPMQSAVGPDNFPPGTNPLTGLQMQDPSILERRPVSIKVQIFPRGQRPPMGISQADIVYDYYQNTGMTRFHAIFYGDNSTQVGPIRSGRLLDRELVQMYSSILAFGSADQRILNRYYNSEMGNRLLMEGYGRCPPLCRIDPNGSNMLVADTAEVSNYAMENDLDNSRPNLNGMTFHDQVPSGGVEATQITIRFSISAYNRWEYNEASRSYLRYQDIQESSGPEDEVMQEMVDKNNDQQITADNVVVLLLPHRYAFGTKSGNNEIIEIQLEGSGPAYAFRDGLFYEAEWHRPENDSVLYLTLPDGSAYPFKPGNTWFEVIGETSEMTNSDGNAYRFNFSIP
jgi:hypothetical protein